MVLKWLLCATILGAVVTASEPVQDDDEVRLPSFFADYMVLQRGSAILWGWGPKDSSVSISVTDFSSNPPQPIFSGEAETSNTSGRFEFTIATPRPILNATIVVKGTNVVSLTNVAFGDVYLCSGQSNMQYPMADAFNGADEREHHADFPELRLLTLATTTAPSDATDVKSLAPYTWAPSSMATISPRTTDGTFGVPYPAAVCFYAVRELLRSPPSNESAPIGIITAAVGGTPIEKWMSAEAMVDGTPASLGGNGSCGGTVAVDASLVGNSTCNSSAPGVSELYHGMIAPLVPMRLSAIMWYQGEENDHAEDACYGPEWYRCLFPSMIQSWRTAFRNPELPFLYVLLAGGHTALMREAQYLGAGALNHTTFATAMDLGAFGDEFLVPGHPPRKQEVGRRLSLGLRNLVYGSGASRGPRMNSSGVVVTRSSSGQLIAEVPFIVDTTVKGTLHLNATGSCNGSSPEVCCNIADTPSSWVIAFRDLNTPTKVEAAVNISIDVERGIVTAYAPDTIPLSVRIIEVRVHFDNNPTCALYSGELSGPDSIYARDPHFGLVAEMDRMTFAVSQAATSI